MRQGRRGSEGDRLVKARLFGDDRSDSVHKQVMKARLLRELGQPTRGEETQNTGESHDPSGSGTHPPLSPLTSTPVRIDRFAILSKIGQGGMGVVYAAFDEQLDRKVAIKLLRRELTADERGRVRMLREAQALARLSHPNVVQVHEVGCWRDHDYVAMEFVAGQTLDRWLGERPMNERPRPWREGLALLLQAGRGLAAAHARDLVHRDFKPANVVVGEDGRVRVLDFGLARSVHERGEDNLSVGAIDETMEQTGVEPTLASNPTLSSAFDRELTATGAVLGTPAYMAPEQHLGRAATVLSDQFSFCVVLYEALFGERPFAASSRSEYAFRVIEGKFEVPGPKSGVPVWLRKAVLRGLAPSPSDRWPSMDALLTELARERGRVWRIGALAAGFAAVLAAGFLLQPDAPALCVADDDALQGVWDDARRSELQAAFAASGLEQSERTLARVSARVDEQASALVAARGHACEDRWIRQEQTDAQFALRNDCLAQRTRELRATLDALTSGSRQTLAHAVELLDGLGDVGFCEQIDLLEEGALAPKDAAAVEQIAALRERIADAHALRLASDVAGAWTIAKAIAPEVDALDYGPLRAELAYLQGRLEQREERFEAARASLLSAATLSEEFGHLELAPSAWTDLLLIERGRTNEDPRESITFRMSTASLRRIRASDEDLRRRQLDYTLAHRLVDANRPSEALEVFEGSLVRLDRLTSAPAEVQRMWTLRGRAEALEALGRATEAERDYRASRGLAVELQGERSLGCADIDFDLGLLLLDSESGVDEGLTRIERARSIYADAYLGGSSRLAMADLALANHALLAGNPDEALTLAQRALDALPPNHGDRSWALDAIAVIQLNRADNSAAEAALDEAIETHLREGRAAHTDLAFIRMQRGHLWVQQGKFDQAIQEFEAVASVYAASLSHDHPDWIALYVGKGDALLGLGRASDAMAEFARAEALVGEDESDRRLRASVEWGMARAATATGKLEAGQVRARAAGALLRELNSHDPMLDEIEAFLDRD